MANITLVTASGSTVTPKDDGLIYEVFSPGNGLIYGGVVSIKDSSTLHITAGHGIVCGRKFTIDDADIPVVLSGSGTLNGRLYIHLDLADVAEPIALLVETGSTLSPEVRDSDVNINNGVYDINIATFTVSTTTIADLVNIDNHIAPIDFGTADISGIGDGSIKGAISELNADITTVEIAVNNLDKYTLIDYIVGPLVGSDLDSQTTDLSQFKRIAVGYTYGEKSYIGYMELPMDVFDNGAVMTVYNPLNTAAYMQIAWSSNTKVKMNFDVKSGYRGVILGIK